MRTRLTIVLTLVLSSLNAAAEEAPTSPNVTAAQTWMRAVFARDRAALIAATALPFENASAGGLAPVGKMKKKCRKKTKAKNAKQLGGVIDCMLAEGRDSYFSMCGEDEGCMSELPPQLTEIGTDDEDLQRAASPKLPKRMAKLAKQGYTLVGLVTHDNATAVVLVLAVKDGKVAVVLEEISGYE